MNNKKSLFVSDLKAVLSVLSVSEYVQETNEITHI